jgi:hypothetical protein
MSRAYLPTKSSLRDQKLIELSTALQQLFPLVEQYYGRTHPMFYHFQRALQGESIPLLKEAYRAWDEQPATLKAKVLELAEQVQKKEITA